MTTSATSAPNRPLPRRVRITTPDRRGGARPEVISPSGLVRRTGATAEPTLRTHGDHVLRTADHAAGRARPRTAGGDVRPLDADETPARATGQPAGPRLPRARRRHRRHGDDRRAQLDGLVRHHG